MNIACQTSQPACHLLTDSWKLRKKQKVTQECKKLRKNSNELIKEGHRNQIQRRGFNAQIWDRSNSLHLLCCLGVGGSRLMSMGEMQRRQRESREGPGPSLEERSKGGSWGCCPAGLSLTLVVTKYIIYMDQGKRNTDWRGWSLLLNCLLSRRDSFKRQHGALLKRQTPEPGSAPACCLCDLGSRRKPRNQIHTQPMAWNQGQLTSSL